MSSVPPPGPFPAMSAPYGPLPRAGWLQDAPVILPFPLEEEEDGEKS